MKKKKKRRLRLGRLLLMIVMTCAAVAGMLYFGTYGIKSLQTMQASQDEASRRQIISDHAKAIETIQKGNILQVVKHSGFTDDELRACFFTSELDEEQTNRVSRSMSETGQALISPSDLRCVRILYHDFNDNSVIGEIFVNEKIAKDTEDLFYDLYIHDYPLEKVVPVENYGGQITTSMNENNTYGYSARNAEGQDPAENPHAYGMAIDINPLYNPLVTISGERTFSYPMEGQPYADRSMLQKYMIGDQDYAIVAFEKFGFSWGGKNDPSWQDYKHFQKSFTPPSKQHHADPAPEQPDNQGDPNAQQPSEQPADSAEQPSAEQIPQAEDPAFEEQPLEAPVEEWSNQAAPVESPAEPVI